MTLTNKLKILTTQLTLQQSGLILLALMKLKVAREAGTEYASFVVLNDSTKADLKRIHFLTCSDSETQIEPFLCS
jgi:hypothetical protein